MVHMGNGQVGREDRHGIAENEVLASIEDSFLSFREMIQTEKTGAFISPPFTHRGCAALDSSRVILEAS
jgi:hypothetical protein